MLLTPRGYSMSPCVSLFLPLRAIASMLPFIPLSQSNDRRGKKRKKERDWSKTANFSGMDLTCKHPAALAHNDALRAPIF